MTLLKTTKLFTAFIALFFLVILSTGTALGDVTEDLNVVVEAGKEWSYTVENNEWVSFTLSIKSGPAVNFYLMPSSESANYANKDVIGSNFNPTTADEGVKSASHTKVSINKDEVYIFMIDNKAGGETAEGTLSITTPRGPGGAFSSGFSLLPFFAISIILIGAVFLHKRSASFNY
ncbi:MAG: hypothetical protein QW728_01955 [Thermoplasmata archaeon]